MSFGGHSFFVAALLCGRIGANVKGGGTLEERIEIVHTNDLHSHLENWPKLRRYLLNKRQLATKKGEAFFAFDLGDFSDRWHPLTEATNGQGNTALMNTVHYDAVTIGNNEGVGNSKAQLDCLYQEANFPVLLANLIDPATGKIPTWAKDELILTTPAGTKLGLFGMTAPFPRTYEPNGWQILEPIDLLPQIIQRLRPQVDVLIFLSHLGIGADRAIASQFTGIDLILESHTHHAFLKGEWVNGTLLAAAGKYGEYVGEVQLTLKDGVLQEELAWLVETAQLTEDPHDAEEIQSYYAGGQALLAQQVLGRIPTDYSLDVTSGHSFIQLALKALQQQTGVACSILNSGLFLQALPQGTVNADELHEALPHPMHLIKVRLLGRDFKRLIYEMEKNRNFLRIFPMRGMGFRGKIFGEIVYDGVTYLPETKEVFYQDQLVVENRWYQLVTVDHFMFIPFFPTIEIVGEVEFLFPNFLRQVVGAYVKERYPI